MATMNKQSVRNEFDRLKAEFKQLSENKKIPPETVMLINGLIMLLSLILSIFLEKNTQKTNTNSSKPSSQTEKDESATTNTGTNGKGKQESNATANNTRTVETVTIAKVTQCDVCGQDLTNVACQHIERRTKIDIIFEKTVEHVDAEIKHCTNCDSTGER